MRTNSYDRSILVMQPLEQVILPALLNNRYERDLRDLEEQRSGILRKGVEGRNAVSDDCGEERNRIYAGQAEYVPQAVVPRQCHDCRRAREESRKGRPDRRAWFIEAEVSVRELAASTDQLTG